MLKLPLPSQEYLLSALDYDPQTGALTWKRRGDASPNWNGKYAGKPAGFKRTYVNIKICGKGYLAHRIIWMMVYGEEPDTIDHTNLNKHDNRIDNLRSVSHSVNMRNKPAYNDPASGHKYIWFSDKMGKWVVQMVVPGKGQRQVAWEETLDAAIAKRDMFLRKHGYDEFSMANGLEP